MFRLLTTVYFSLMKASILVCVLPRPLLSSPFLLLSSPSLENLFFFIDDPYGTDSSYLELKLAFLYESV